MKFNVFMFCLLISGLGYCQNDPSNNPFNNPSGRTYEDLRNKQNREMRKDINNLKKDFQNTYDIASYTQQSNLSTQNFGPGAPGEPVPINSWCYYLIMVAGGILIFYKKKL